MRRVDRTFAIATAMASRLRAMAEAVEVAPPAAVAALPAAPASTAAAPLPAITALTPAAIVRTGRSALRKPDIEDRAFDRGGSSRFALCSHFRTFDATSGTYRGFDGVTHACRLGEGHRAGSTSAKAASAPAAPVDAAVAGKSELVPSGSYGFAW